MRIININYRKFTLEFLSFKLHIHGDDQSEEIICSDYLSISYNNTEGKPLCEKYRGVKVIVAEEIILKFITDNRHTDEGFKLHYSGKCIT